MTILKLVLAKFPHRLFESIQRLSRLEAVSQPQLAIIQQPEATSSNQQYPSRNQQSSSNQ